MVDSGVGDSGFSCADDDVGCTVVVVVSAAAAAVAVADAVADAVAVDVRLAESVKSDSALCQLMGSSWVMNCFRRSRYCP